jgi:hypothetical protein
MSHLAKIRDKLHHDYPLTSSQTIRKIARPQNSNLGSSFSGLKCWCQMLAPAEVREQQSHSAENGLFNQDKKQLARKKILGH